MRLQIIIAAMLLLSSEVLQAEGGLTLGESLRLALKNDPGLESASASVRSAELSLSNAKKGLGYRTDLTLGLTQTQDNQQRLGSLQLRQTLPTGGSLNLLSNVNQDRTSKGLFGTSPATELSYGISLEQELFTDNVQKLNVESARLTLQAQRTALENKRRTLNLSVTKAFYAVVRQEKNLEVREKAGALAKVLSELLKEQFEKGVSVEMDLLESEVQRSRSEVYSEIARLNLEKARTDFLSGLGIPLDSPFSLDYKLTLEEIVFPSGETISEAVAEHPQVREIDLRIAQNELETISVRNQFDTKLSLTGGYSRWASDGGLRSTAEDFEGDWSFGVRLALPLWDRGITEQNIRAMAFKKQALEAQRSAEIRRIQREVEKGRRNLKRLRETVRLLEKAETYARSNLELANRKFGMGLNRAEDVIRAQQTLTNARLEVIEEIINYKLTMADLYALTALPAFVPEVTR